MSAIKVVIEGYKDVQRFLQAKILAHLPIGEGRKVA